MELFIFKCCCTLKGEGEYVPPDHGGGGDYNRDVHVVQLITAPGPDIAMEAMEATYGRHAIYEVPEQVARVGVP